MLSAGFSFSKLKNNVSIDGVDVGGLNVFDAEKRVNDNFIEKLKTKTFSLIIDEHIYNFYYPDIAADTNISQTVRIAEKERKNNVNYSISAKYYIRDLDKIIDAAAYEISAAPKDAQVAFNPNGYNMFQITDGVNGKQLNKRKLAIEIQTALNKGAEFLNFKCDIIYPKINEEILRKSTYLRARFSTAFENSSIERKHNIALSLASVNGTVLEPDRQFSFNAVVGKRTEERGYKLAKIIINGKFEDGIGGGVCQSSTTIYNCALLADLEIIKYTRHTIPVSYVPLSFDAMVNSGGSDMAFKNDSGGYIFIKAYTRNDNAVAEIYGIKLPPGLKIERESILKNTLPAPPEKVEKDIKKEYPELLPGQQLLTENSREGYESEGYLNYYRYGVLEKRVLLRKDKYPPQRGLIIEGTNDG